MCLRCRGLGGGGGGPGRLLETRRRAGGWEQSRAESLSPGREQQRGLAWSGLAASGSYVSGRHAVPPPPTSLRRATLL